MVREAKGAVRQMAYFYPLLDWLLDAALSWHLLLLLLLVVMVTAALCWCLAICPSWASMALRISHLNHQWLACEDSIT